MVRRNFLGRLLVGMFGWKLAEQAVEPPLVTSGLAISGPIDDMGTLTVTEGTSTTWVDINASKAPWTYTDAL